MCNWYTIKAVLVDNTNTNTGCEGGLVTLLEKKLNEIFTQLVAPYIKMNSNLELYSNIFFDILDGTTNSHTTLKGPLGKLGANDCHNLPQKSFSVVENSLEFHFRMKDMDSLCSDQRLLYEYRVGISRGKVGPRFAS